MTNDDVTRHLESMNDLDFKAWNGADWDGLFAHLHTDDVFVDVQGQPPTHGIREHIDAMKAMVQASGESPYRSSPIRSRSDPATGRAWSESSRTAAA